MKKLIHFAVLAMLLPLCVCCGKVADNTGTDEDPEVFNPKAWSLNMGLGWNLGNSLDAHAGGVSSETCWGNGKASQKTFDAIRSMGFGCVRIPITWMGHIGEAPAYTIESAWMNRVAEVVGYAHKAGLKVIINVHHDGYRENAQVRGGWLDIRSAFESDAADRQIRARLAAVWKQIAERFKNEGDWLVFETMNEIHDGGWGYGDNLKNSRQYNILNEWNQLCLDAIRSAGGCNADRYVALAGYATNPSLTVNYLRLPKDSAENRLVVAVHSYDPYEYATEAKFDEWGHTGKTMAPGSSELDYTMMLDNLVKKFLLNGVPVYMGEFGCVHRSSEKAESFRKYYLEYTVKAMRDRGIAPIVWDNGSAAAGKEAFGLVNHADGSCINNAREIVRTMVNAWSNNDEKYTLSSVYDKAPQF